MLLIKRRATVTCESCCRVGFFLQRRFSLRTTTTNQVARLERMLLEVLCRLLFIRGGNDRAQMKLFVLRRTQLQPIKCQGAFCVTRHLLSANGSLVVVEVIKNTHTGRRAVDDFTVQKLDVCILNADAC